MLKQKVELSEESLRALAYVRGQLSRKMELKEMVDSAIAFCGFMFHCAEEDELFRENLNNVMNTSDFKKFLTREPG